MELKDLNYSVSYYDTGKTYGKTIADPIVPDYVKDNLSLESISNLVLDNMINQGFKMNFNDSTYLKYDENTGILSSTQPIKIQDKDLKDVGEVTFSLKVLVPADRNSFNFKLSESHKKGSISIKQLNKRLRECL